jgi:hypothetical protein
MWKFEEQLSEKKKKNNETDLGSWRHCGGVTSFGSDFGVRNKLFVLREWLTPRRN